MTQVVVARGDKYRDDLIQQIKEAGQELIDRAEEMVGKNTDAITGFNIYIDFPQGEYMPIPEISWTTDVACNNTLKRYYPRTYKKETPEHSEEVID